jgi:hypothetical protein
MKYLTEERFIVNSNDSEAHRKYLENYDKIFRSEPEPPAPEPEPRVVEIDHFCATCDALIPPPENGDHEGHAFVKINAKCATCGVTAARDVRGLPICYDCEPNRARPCTDAIETRIATYMWFCKMCDAYVSDPENHTVHGVIKVTE